MKKRNGRPMAKWKQQKKKKTEAFADDDYLTYADQFF